ncbi:MAG TPA: hypothetical protein VFI96_09345 [Longimicrobiaceae bacterium]|nr:hypothetical protein [Longimicrobiaceae bacterium]
MSDPMPGPVTLQVNPSRRILLEVFAAADGHDSLDSVLREAVDFYIAERIRRGREGVRTPETSTL